MQNWNELAKATECGDSFSLSSALINQRKHKLQRKEELVQNFCAWLPNLTFQSLHLQFSVGVQTFAWQERGRGPTC